MKRSTAGLNEDQRKFIKAFEALTYAQPDWKAWTDFITMAACSIANAVDRGPRWQERERMYMEIAGRYKPEQLGVFAELLAIVAEALERDPEQDFLGVMFQDLELNSHWHGQFFTPYHVCKFMAQVVNVDGDQAEIEEKGYISVNDPACGAGALLIAAANAYRASGINYQTSVLFVAQDIDFTAAMMCYIQLSLLGCSGYVIVGDTLRNPPTDPLPDDYQVWYTPFYFTDVWHWRRIFRTLDRMMPVRPRERAAAPGYFFFFFENDVLQSTAMKGDHYAGRCQEEDRSRDENG